MDYCKDFHFEWEGGQQEGFWHKSFMMWLAFKNIHLFSVCRNDWTERVDRRLLQVAQKKWWWLGSGLKWWGQWDGWDVFENKAPSACTHICTHIYICDILDQQY